MKYRLLATASSNTFFSLDSTNWNGIVMNELTKELLFDTKWTEWVEWME